MGGHKPIWLYGKCDCVCVREGAVFQLRDKERPITLLEEDESDSGGQSLNGEIQTHNTKKS